MITIKLKKLLAWVTCWALLQSNVLHAKTDGSFSFNHLVVFGDSLSYVGMPWDTNMFISKNNVAQMYTNVLSRFLTDKNTKYYLDGGGSNYAMNGAIIKFRTSLLEIPFNFLRSNITVQVKQYYQQRNNIANANDIFIFWAGANDLFTQVPTIAISPRKLINAIQYNDHSILVDKHYVSSWFAKFIADLVQHNANTNNAFVLTLPNGEYVPMRSMDDVALLSFLPFGKERMKTADRYLRNYQHRIADAKTIGGLAYTRLNHIQAIMQRYSLIPQSIITTLYNSLGNFIRFIVNTHNDTLRVTLEQTGLPVIYADVHGLLEEVQDKYWDYGIDEVLVPECQQQLSNQLCVDLTDKDDSNRVYMYFDSYHPSAFTHQIIGQYLIQFITAPRYVSTLAKTTNLSLQSRHDYLSSILHTIAPPESEQLSPYLFVSLNGSLHYQSTSKMNWSRFSVTPDLNLGIRANLTPESIVAGMISGSFHRAHPSPQYHFTRHDIGIALATKYKISDYWASSDVIYSHTHYKNMRRTIPLGVMHRIENGTKTNGSAYLASVAMGYDRTLTNQKLHINPYVSYTQGKIKAGGYTEQGNTSTTMRFGKQQYHVRELGAGVLVTNSDPTLSSHLLWGLKRDMTKNKLGRINAGLVRTTSSYNQLVNPVASKNTWHIGAGLTYHGKQIDFNTGVNFKLQQHAQKSFNVNLSLSYQI